MADAVAPVSLMASSTLAKTGLPRCSVPAFLGFVPPTTFVPVLGCQFVSSVLSDRVAVRAHTIFDGLLGMESASCQPLHHLYNLVYCTHVPCLPVKPWNSTLVSPLMRRFLIVWAYGDELVAYPCRAAAVRRAELRGFRRACIVTMELPRKQIWEEKGGIGWVREVVVGQRRCAVKALPNFCPPKRNIEIPALRPFFPKMPR
jgi:hypothetical protein